MKIGVTSTGPTLDDMVADAEWGVEEAGEAD